MYLSKLAPGGILVFNVSNRYLKLRNVLGGLARAEGLAGMLRHDQRSAAEEKQEGILSSEYVVLARKVEDLGPLVASDKWEKLSTEKTLPVWSDQYSSILSLF